MSFTFLIFYTLKMSLFQYESYCLGLTLPSKNQAVHKVFPQLQLSNAFLTTVQDYITLLLLLYYIRCFVCFVLFNGSHDLLIIKWKYTERETKYVTNFQERDSLEIGRKYGYCHANAEDLTYSDDNMKDGMLATWETILNCTCTLVCVENCSVSHCYIQHTSNWKEIFIT